ncbi:MAG: lipopolysaccharide assembly protein LapA domain-containing protein [Thiopseudomonas sp.]|nr:lipopolysaccharide assembly protein LapA domain-containing protein [Thiopseudomonas sp.]MCK9465282.1 lipopolysaccharide assembly protein LapA domain-containing protein [Thiopseudomonas sp.]
MQKIKRAIVFVFLLAVALVVLLFTMENRQLVHLSLMGKETPDLPLALFVLVVFVVGLIVGFAINWLRSKGLEHKFRKQAKQLDKLRLEQKNSQEKTNLAEVSQS